MDAQLKGGAFLSTFAFVESRFGADGKLALLRALSAEDRGQLESIIMPISWYPLELFHRLLRTMDRTLGRGDLVLPLERGRFAAVHDITKMNRVLLKFVTPLWIINHATALWPRMHTTGYWETSALGPKKARAALLDLGVVDEAFCATMRGWILGLFDLANCTAVVTHTQCRSHGANACVFLPAWERGTSPKSPRALRREGSD